jgi:hypothetical protein
VQNDPRNEIAGDYEEDVYTNVAAWQSFREGMEHYNARHGEGAQSIDIGAIVGAVCGLQLVLAFGGLLTAHIGCLGTN